MRGINDEIRSMRYAVWARGVTDCVSRVGGEEKGREYTTGAARSASETGRKIRYRATDGTGGERSMV